MKTIIDGPEYPKEVSERYSFHLPIRVKIILTTMGLVALTLLGAALCI